MTTPRPNRLARESSPYLLQHAHNPVDWYPWGLEAFTEARRRDVPIFLSVGYSTCYWCHVMERESFESDAIAALLNERCVSVKLDREERPDVDEVYMAAVQMLTGHGGWPMSVLLEPQTLRPFWAGTYFPPVPSRGMPSFPQVIEGVTTAWRTQRADVLAQAEQIAAAVREHLGERRASVPIGIPQVAGAVSALLTTYDRIRGGFGGAPKFPQPVYLDLMLEFLPFAADDRSRAAVEAALRHTLDRMAIGGMFDQVGGGFHRYSVDAEWTVPHFEKMLYDNAQLAAVYARAAAMFGDEFYRRVTRRTCDYVLREMVAPGGGFCSAQDAEVDGREGLNYLWTPDQVRTALNGDDADFAVKVYGVDRGANFHDPHHPDAPPAWVLRLDDRPERVAATMGIESADFTARLDRVNAALYAARSKRKQPRQDTKVLTGWNGLMITALGLAGRVLGESRWPEAAAAAVRSVLAVSRVDGGLPRSIGGKLPAVLEDYGAMVGGLAEIARAGRDADGSLFRAARELAEEIAGRFGDGEGGFFDSQAGASELFVRPRSTYDGAVPCGRSLTASGLMDLYEVTRERRWLDVAGRALASMSAAIAASPVSTALSTRTLLRALVADPALMPGLIAGTPGAALARPADFTPVQVFASEDRLPLKQREPASLTLRLTIAPGYHVTAADPGDHPDAASLIGLRVSHARGEGLRVYADYPIGDLYGPGGALRVYRGEVDIPVVIEREGTWGGRPVLTVAFQACTDTECLEPMTVELDVALDPA